jgi:hypothetical protein
MTPLDDAGLLAYTRRRVIFAVLGRQYGMTNTEVENASRADPDHEAMQARGEERTRLAMDQTLDALYAEGLVEMGEGDDALIQATGRLEMETDLWGVSDTEAGTLLRAKLMYMAEAGSIDDELAEALVHARMAMNAGELRDAELASVLSSERFTEAFKRMRTRAIDPDLDVHFAVHHPRHLRAS